MKPWMDMRSSNGARDATGPAEGWVRKEASGILGLLLVIAGLQWWLGGPEVVRQYDAAVYITGARSLAEGAGYRFVDHVGTPGIGLYPPGHSLGLSMVWRLRPEFPDNLGYLTAWVIGMGCVALGLIYGILRHWEVPRGPALAGVALLGVSPIWIHGHQMLGSDFQFLALSFLAALPWLIQRPRSEKIRWLCTGVAIGLAYLTRSAAQAYGLALCPVAILLFVRRQRIAALALAVPFFVAAISWQMMSTDTVRYVEVFQAHMGNSWESYFRLLLSNGLESLEGLPFWRLFCPYIGFAPGIAQRYGEGLRILVQGFTTGLFLMLLLGMLREALSEKRPSQRCILGFSLVYAGQILVLPVQADHFGRFLMPLSPVFLALAWRMACRSRFSGWIFGPGVAGLMVLNLAYLVPRAGDPYDNKHLGEVREVAEWLRAHTKPDALVVVSWTQPFPYIAQWSGRSLVTDYLDGPDAGGEPVSHAHQGLVQGDWLVAGPGDARRENPGHPLQQAFSSSGGAYQVYKVLPKLKLPSE